MYAIRSYYDQASVGKLVDPARFRFHRVFVQIRELLGHRGLALVSGQYAVRDAMLDDRVVGCARLQQLSYNFV